MKYVLYQSFQRKAIKLIILYHKSAKNSIAAWNLSKWIDFAQIIMILRSISTNSNAMMLSVYSAEYQNMLVPYVFSYTRYQRIPICYFDTIMLE